MGPMKVLSTGWKNNKDFPPTRNGVACGRFGVNKEFLLDWGMFSSFLLFHHSFLLAFSLVSELWIKLQVTSSKLDKMEVISSK